MKKNFTEIMLMVRNIINKDYLVYKDLLDEKQIAPENWHNACFLPSLILLPVLLAKDVEHEELSLAAMIEMSYLAQFIHNNAPEKGSGDDYRMPILIGDFMFASAIKGLVEENHTRWLERMGNVICRMNEGRAVRSSWQERSYVPVDEKVENLQKEYAELSALAGIIGSELADFDQETTQLYTAFAFYAGVIQGIIVNGYNEQQSGVADTYNSYCEQYIAAMPQELAAGAAWILAHLLGKSKVSASPAVQHNLA